MPPDEVLEAPAPAAPAPAAPAAPAAAPVSGAEPKPAAPVAADWAADWRNKITADPKETKRLERFASPQAIWTAYRAAENRINSGELRAPLPEKPTEEQVTQWRKDNGIPDKPDGYDTKGLELGETDKPIIDKLTKFAHERHWSPKVVKEALEVRKALIDEIKSQEEVQDAESRQQTEDTYRAEWGADYRRNGNLITNYLNVTGADPEIIEDVNNAIKLNPKMGKWLIACALRDNPMGTLVGGTGSDQIESVETELAGLKKMMGDQSSAYWKGPMADKNQLRYRQLLEHQQRMKK